MSAVYLEIRNDILEKIHSGYYPIGETIPAETELAKQYNVSRPTIRQAIQALVDQGILEKRRKRGTIVCPGKIDQEFTQRIDSFDAQIHQKGHTSQTKVLTFQKEEASQTVQEILQCDTVYKLVRLRYIDQSPNVFTVTYMPYELFKHFDKIDFSKESFYEQCKQCGHPIATVTRHLEVVSADETLADLLHVNIKDPLFYFHSYGKDPQGIPIEYSIAKYRGDTNSFSFTLQRDNP